MSPSEVLASHTAEEISEWEQEFAMQPFGTAEVVSLLAELCAVTANGHGIKRTGGGAWKSQDFCKTIQDAPAKESDESISAKLDVLAKSNAKKAKKKKPNAGKS
jgi:hypothetical protein